MCYLIKKCIIILSWWVIVIIYKNSSMLLDTAKDNDELFLVPQELKWKIKSF